jgi:hypothetical protein
MFQRKDKAPPEVWNLGSAWTNPLVQLPSSGWSFLAHATVSRSNVATERELHFNDHPS